jgi:hypothetical protein
LSHAQTGKTPAPEHEAQILGCLKPSRLGHGLLISLGSYKFEIREFPWSEVHPQKPESGFALLLSALFAVNPFPVLPFAAIENRRPRGIRGIRGIRGNGAGGKAGRSEPRKRTERQEKNRRKEAQNDTKKKSCLSVSVVLCGNPLSVFSLSACSA